jgi:cell division transport system permease protein
MHKWLNQHIQAASVVLHRLHLQLLSTILIMTVIGVTLAIPSLIYVMLQNANTLIMDVKKEAKMSVFLQQNASQTTIDAIKTKLGNQSDIEEFTFVSKDTALKQLIETTDNPELIASLEDNPLPHAFFIKPASIDKSALKSLKSNLEQLDGVAEVVVDSGWVNRLNSLLSIGKKAVWIFGCLLGFALIAVISNTIRMQILTHKDEIEVSELFGATKSFIRRPFLYLGTLYGLGGGIIACLLLWLVLYTFNQSVIQIAKEYASDFTLQFNAAPTFLYMIAVSVLIGWLASYWAVTLRSPAQ